jgi:hypothetical protein
MNWRSSDCCENNMMFDPSGMYPDLYHPVWTERRRDFAGRATHYSRTQRPPKYYLIDFGLSRRYEGDISAVVEPVIVGGERTAPEHAKDRGATPCNPFQTDVYSRQHGPRRIHSRASTQSMHAVGFYQTKHAENLQFPVHGTTHPRYDTERYGQAASYG